MYIPDSFNFDTVSFLVYRVWNCSVTVLWLICLWLVLTTIWSNFAFVALALSSGKITCSGIVTIIWAWSFCNKHFCWVSEILLVKSVEGKSSYFALGMPKGSSKTPNPGVPRLISTFETPGFTFWWSSLSSGFFFQPRGTPGFIFTTNFSKKRA